MVLATSDLPRGDAIGVHRHLREDEIILVTRGTARVQLGKQEYTASTGTTLFIPQGTCIALANAGRDTFSMIFVFSSPGFEQVLRELSSPEGAPPKPYSPERRAAAYQRGHAEAASTKCWPAERSSTYDSPVLLASLPPGSASRASLVP
jgi:oxalate decarboxylase/phosphoglucose isomerase-like protein (cupin superfamily)